MEVRLSAVFSRAGSRGRCWPPSTCHLAAAFLMLFSLGQRCNVNTNEMEPCLLTSPLQTEGEREIKSVSVCVCETPTTHRSLATILAAKNNVLLRVMFYCIEFEALLFFVLFCNQENLIQYTDPDSLQVSTKDMDSTLSKASRAIKKTSKKVRGAEKLVSHEMGPDTVYM